MVSYNLRLGRKTHQNKLPQILSNTNFHFESSFSNKRTPIHVWLKGCGMGPWLVLVSPCFRENEVDTCKIGSFLCSLDNLPQKNVQLFSFLEITFQNGAHLKKGLFLTYFSHFLVTREKLSKIPSAHISNTYIHVFCSPYWLFLPYQFWQKIRIYQVQFLFGMSPGVDSYSRHFETINK